MIKNIIKAAAHRALDGIEAGNMAHFWLMDKAKFTYLVAKAVEGVSLGAMSIPPKKYAAFLEYVLALEKSRNMALLREGHACIDEEVSVEEAWERLNTRYDTALIKMLDLINAELGKKTL